MGPKGALPRSNDSAIVSVPVFSQPTAYTDTRFLRSMLNTVLLSAWYLQITESDLVLNSLWKFIYCLKIPLIILENGSKFLYYTLEYQFSNLNIQTILIFSVI
jgi:hypothetical protein